MSKKDKRVCRTFSDEFKKDAIGLVTNAGYSTKQAADAVGVSSSSIRDWIRKVGPAPVPCGQDASVEDLVEENRRLKKQLREAELERAILKNPRRILRRSRCEVRLDQGQQRLFSYRHHVPSPTSEQKRLLRLANPKAE